MGMVLARQAVVLDVLGEGIVAECAEARADAGVTVLGVGCQQPMRFAGLAGVLLIRVKVPKPRTSSCPQQPD
jgi:hypothetical protein